MTIDPKMSGDADRSSRHPPTKDRQHRSSRPPDATTPLFSEYCSRSIQRITRCLKADWELLPHIKNRIRQKHTHTHTRARAHSNILGHQMMTQMASPGMFSWIRLKRTTSGHQAGLMSKGVGWDHGGFTLSQWSVANFGSRKMSSPKPGKAPPFGRSDF